MKIIKYNIEICILISVIFLLLYSSDPIIYSDSNRYLNGSLKDPPLYSNIITLMEFIFGSLNSVIAIQTLFIAFGIIHLLKTFTTYLSINFITRVITSAFLLLPIIIFYNHLLTEPFGYAFSLFFVSYGIRLIHNFDNQNLIWITIFVILLLLLRNQFVFLYPVILIIYTGTCILYNSKKVNIGLIISFISILLIHNSTIKINKYIKKINQKNVSLYLLNEYHGPFRMASNDILYVSTIKDIKLFKDHELQETLRKIYKKMDNQKLLFKYNNNRGHFSISYPKIDDNTEALLIDLAIRKNTTTKKLRKEIFYTLIKENYYEYSILLFKKFYDSTWLFIIIPIIIFTNSLVNFLKYKSHFSLVAIFISIFALSNHSIIYLFGRVQPRYFVYTDFILLIFIFITFTIFYKKIRLK
jgi:hypothetical protein